MKNPNIKTKVIHSETKPAWNVVGIKLGGKYKICRVPYIITENEKLNVMNKNEALEHAEYISSCFNNSNIISKLI